MEKIGLYIHIPFCKSKCPYCDFYSKKSDICGYDDYTMCVLESLEMWAEKSGRQADTLYIGGGTPSIIGGRNIAMIVRRAKMLFGVDGEITVECNPSAIEDGFFETVAKSGANRISLGMQSAVDSERKKLGRLSDSEAVLKRIKEARNAGITNISLDIMLGVPEQTAESLNQTIDFCINTGVPHLSAYMLSLEEGTYYYKNKDKLNLPDNDTVADMYMQLSEALVKSGYQHYEISNFAKPGYEGIHNLKYWNCEEYIGIGPSAHSFLNGERFFYPRDLDYFRLGGEPKKDGVGGDAQEYIMLRLRLKEGIIFDEYKKRFGKCLSEKAVSYAANLTEKGYMTADDKGIRLTQKGFLISNSIIAEIEMIADGKKTDK